MDTNPKCASCKCFWKPDETDVKSSGLVAKTCKRCRELAKQRNIKYREENADKIKEYKKKYYDENAEKVREYKKKFQEENAGKLKEQQKKYREENADKIKEYQQKYREENADKIKEQQKIYREENAEKCKQSQKICRENTKCEHNKYRGRCKICNLSLYLVNLQRRQIIRCLNISSQTKAKSSIEYLGCDADYFKNYIQKKMDIYNQTADVKMDFSNIHIDHIKPVSAFNLDEEDDFLDCCNYTNLQPLLIQDNLRKKNKWTDEDDAYWNDNIRGNDEYLEIYIN